MKQLLLFFISLAVSCFANIEQPVLLDIPTANQEVEQTIDYIIATIELSAKIAAKSEKEKVIPHDEIKENYKEMASALNALLENVESPIEAYAFINNKGLNRIVYPYLSDPHPQIKAQVLKLVKILFDKAPTTLSATVSTNMVDQLLEIFKNEEDDVMRKNVLDILANWLPKNPTVQARLMKINGLEILYELIPNLDISLTHSMIKLFTSIVKDHVEVRNSQVSEADKLKLKDYEKVQLLEKLSSSNVCKGLLDIFDNAFQSKEEDKDELFVPILELVKSTNEFCSEHFKKYKKSLIVFENFLAYVKNLQITNAEHVTKAYGDINETEHILSNYVENLQFMKNIKEEF